MHLVYVLETYLPCQRKYDILNISIFNLIQVTVPTQVTALAPVLAIKPLTPKSAIFTLPFVFNNILEGLISS